MEDRPQLIKQIVDDVRADHPLRPVRRLLRVVPGGEGGIFVQDLARALEQEQRRVIRFDLPEYGLDACEHVLGQLCQALEPAELSDHLWDHKLTIHQRLEDVASHMARRRTEAPVLALYIPKSWFQRPEDPRRSLPDNPWSVLSALLHPALDAIVAAASKPRWIEQRLQAVAEDLPTPVAGEGYLFDTTRWHGLTDEARRFADLVGAGASRRAPLVLDLGVACLALGYDKVNQALQKPDPYPDLVDWLREKTRLNREWAPALHKLMLPRFAVPELLMAEITGELRDGERILARCLLHHEAGKVQAAEALRDVIGVSHPGEPAANKRLADYYRECDGVPDARAAVERGNIVPWLERGHHGAHAGPDVSDGVMPLSRLIQYERAWSLSVEFKEYEAAAAVYRSILEDDPDDAYSHHYMAWNLDQAGKEGQTVWREYARAIALEKDNPWYNSRFVTFLRDNGFRRDAHEAWEQAKEHVLSGPWAKRIKLPVHFHYWIARSALDVGDLDLARKVLGELTPHDIKEYPKLGELNEELVQYEEIERLGEPVYPSRVRVVDRWKEPRLLPMHLPVADRRSRSSQLWQAPLMKWYPGRVEEIEQGVVTLVLADPGDRALFTVEVDKPSLLKMAAGEQPRVGRFLEYGVYEGERVYVKYHAPPRTRTKAEHERLEHGMRYMRDDAASESA